MARAEIFPSVCEEYVKSDVMKINDLHRWDVTYHEAVAIRQTLRENDPP